MWYFSISSVNSAFLSNRWYCTHSNDNPTYWDRRLPNTRKYHLFWQVLRHSEKKYHPRLCFGWSTIAPSTKGSMFIISSWEGYFENIPPNVTYLFKSYLIHSVFIFKQSMDCSEFEPFLTLGFSGPSPDQDSIPSFGTFTSCIRDVCVKLLMKVCF